MIQKDRAQRRAFSGPLHGANEGIKARDPSFTWCSFDSFDPRWFQPAGGHLPVG
jgi:hypothetical protein